MRPILVSSKVRLLKLLAMFLLPVLICSCGPLSKQTKPEQDLSPPQPKRAPVQVNVPPPYPELIRQADGSIDPAEIERGFIRGGEVYSACMVELASVKAQAEACVNDPK